MDALPAYLRNELAAQFQWIDSEEEGGSKDIFKKIPFLCQLDSLSMIHIGARLKTTI